MPFKIDTFDGDDLPQWLERSDTQSMGPASAAADFVQLPGGGFYDNYGDFDSPRLLSNITKQTVIYTTAGDGDVRTQVEAWRAKVGKRGVLEALWHDSQVRWLYARLISFTHVRPFNARLTHLPCEFVFAPATGVWYGETQVDDLTTFASTMDTTISISHAGNVNVSDPILRYKADDSHAITLTVENKMTSQKVSVPVLLLGVDEEIVIDVGERTVRIYRTPVDIDSIGRSGTTLTIDTAAVHGLSAGDEIIVEGTNYDGWYTVATVTDTDTITVEIDPLVKQPNGPQTTTGTLFKADDAFNDAIFSDPADWFWLVSGSNTLHVTSDYDLDTSTLRVIYWPTYA